MYCLFVLCIVCFMYCLFVLCTVCFFHVLFICSIYIVCLFYALFVLIVLFCVLFACKCVLYYCNRVSNQFQLKNISYHIIYHIVSKSYLIQFPFLTDLTPWLYKFALYYVIARCMTLIQWWTCKYYKHRAFVSRLYGFWSRSIHKEN